MTKDKKRNLPPWLGRFLFVSGSQVGAGTQNVGTAVHDRPPVLGHGPAERSYFFLVVAFFVDFFELDFLAVVFLAMALDLLSMPRM